MWGPQLSSGEESDAMVRARAVALILLGETEKALEILSRFYGVPVPRVKVGLPKGRSGVLGCYVPSKRTIYLKSSEEYRNPFVVLHEFYHHIRYFAGKHRGTERGANEYALTSIQYFRELSSKLGSLSDA